MAIGIEILNFYGQSFYLDSSDKSHLTFKILVKIEQTFTFILDNETKGKNILSRRIII
jgi:hypothetical protein